MDETTVIIHGWSDCSESFKNIKSLLVQSKFGTVKSIFFADYESREDHMTFSDVIDGLNDQFMKNGIIDADGVKKKDINIICHSTGGLVIRHWIWRYYMKYESRISDCPVKRIVMLAPANFGSPLAHRGKSFFPSLVKGRRNFGDFLETGRQILSGLELASPYQWELAHGDLIRETPYFNAKQIQTTILVGVEGFSGIASVANRPGTDGTVVIAGASLDSAKLSLDFSKPRTDEAYEPFTWVFVKPKGDFAYGVLENLDHSGVVRAAGKRGTQVCDLVLEALRIKDARTFLAFQDKLEDVTKTTYQNTGKPRYQQFIVHAVDDNGRSISDFTIYFYVAKKEKSSKTGESFNYVRLSKEEEHFSRTVLEIMTCEAHTHLEDGSYRSFLVDLESIYRTMMEAKKSLGEDVALCMRVFVPEVDKGIRYDIESIQNIVLYDTEPGKKKWPSFFFENTTTLLELKVNRFNTYVSVQEKPRKH